MSVPVYKRNQSRFVVLHKAFILRRSIMKLIFINFGFSNIKNGSNNTVYYQGTGLENVTEFLKKEREYISNILRNISSNIQKANKIFPTNPEELTQRRLYQDYAIADCFDLQVEMQFCAETVDGINVNVLLNYVKDIEEEILLLKAWRKSDNKIRKTLENKNKNKIVNPFFN